MDERRRVLSLLTDADWGMEQARIDKFKVGAYYPQFVQAVQDLQVDALYQSAVHGSGHINRVMLLGALIAEAEALPSDLFAQYLLACSYHDIGRYFDGLDLEHGTASAHKLPSILPQLQGEVLLELQAAIASHSQPDRRMDGILADYAPQDMERTRKLACLLKDADNLDRVRLGDLKVKFLRHDSAKALAKFSAQLFKLDQTFKANFSA